MMQKRFTLRAAVYLLLLKENKILLVRRFNTGWMDGKYSLIAGHLDGNEPVGDSMMREAYEEAGIEIKKEDLIPATVLHRHSGEQEYVDFFFVCEKWFGIPTIKETNKCDDMQWFPLDNVPDNVLPHVLEAIKNYKAKKPFSESEWK